MFRWYAESDGMVVPVSQSLRAADALPPSPPPTPPSRRGPSPRLRAGPALHRARGLRGQHRRRAAHPQHRARIDYGLAAAQWSLTITFLVGAVSCPVIGRVGDGPRAHPRAARRLSLMVARQRAVRAARMLRAAHRRARAAGPGLSLMPVAMASARDHLPATRARSTIATLSVTAVVGVGLGYPAHGVHRRPLGLHACLLGRRRVRRDRPSIRERAHASRAAVRLAHAVRRAAARS